MVEKRVSGFEFSDLPCLDLGKKSNLTSDDMADIRNQGIAVDDENYPYPEKITYDVPQL